MVPEGGNLILVKYTPSTRADPGSGGPNGGEGSPAPHHGWPPGGGAWGVGRATWELGDMVGAGAARPLALEGPI